jgi:hypothetical protein
MRIEGAFLRTVTAAHLRAARKDLLSERPGAKIRLGECLDELVARMWLAYPLN